jgi:hypothetical protein
MLSETVTDTFFLGLTSKVVSQVTTYKKKIQNIYYSNHGPTGSKGQGTDF